MSDYLAVGGVSAVLRSLLTSALTNGGPSYDPRLHPRNHGNLARPDSRPARTSSRRSTCSCTTPASTRPCGTWACHRSSAQGRRLSNPPLALNLHYLISAYGSKQFDPEILLAWAMKVFHDTPVVPSQTIQNALTDLGSQPQSSAEAQLIASKHAGRPDRAHQDHARDADDGGDLPAVDGLPDHLPPEHRASGLRRRHPGHPGVRVESARPDPDRYRAAAADAGHR